MQQEIENLTSKQQPGEVINAIALECFNYEKIFYDTKATLIKNIQVHYPQLNTLSESDPLIKTLQVVAYRELLIRQKIKDTIKSSLISRASGKNLAQLAQLILEKDKIENKIDGEIKNSLLIFWKKTLYYTTGTASAYKYFAKQIAEKLIRDVGVIKKSASEIGIYLLLEKEHGLNQEDKNKLLKKTKEHLYNAETRRITDKIEIAFANIIPYSLIANIELFPNYSLEAIKPTIKLALAKITDLRFYLGKTLATKYFFKSFYQHGVKNVSLEIILENKKRVKNTQLPANATYAYNWDNNLQFQINA